LDVYENAIGRPSSRAATGMVVMTAALGVHSMTTLVAPDADPDTMIVPLPGKITREAAELRMLIPALTDTPVKLLKMVCVSGLPPSALLKGMPCVATREEAPKASVAFSVMLPAEARVTVPVPVNEPPEFMVTPLA